MKEFYEEVLKFVMGATMILATVTTLTLAVTAPLALMVWILTRTVKLAWGY